jgi:hypothetical protein
MHAAHMALVEFGADRRGSGKLCATEMMVVDLYIARAVAS